MMSHSVSRDSLESLPYIARYSEGLPNFYFFKLHEYWIISFLKLRTLLNFTFSDQHILIKYPPITVQGNKIRFLCILAYI